MLRGAQVDLSPVRGATGEGAGVPHAGALLAYTDAVMASDAAAIARTSVALARAIGVAGVVDTAAVIAVFNVVDRVADATGIPIDEVTRDFRYAVGEELLMGHLTPEARGR